MFKWQTQKRIYIHTYINRCVYKFLQSFANAHSTMHKKRNMLLSESIRRDSAKLQRMAAFKGPLEWAVKCPVLSERAIEYPAQQLSCSAAQLLWVLCPVSTRLGQSRSVPSSSVHCWQCIVNNRLDRVAARRLALEFRWNLIKLPERCCRWRCWAVGVLVLLGRGKNVVVRLLRLAEQHL